ncbi:alpha/beta hydrolase [Streptomyces tuirus]|uniref:Alpha/beta hydrolase n=1 Tax=Streptomyces tuirus TaxID=68278 RepID=A0A941F9H7_9ACTN|nr:alpha/beta hydrolase [Streptomyces tuirus]
MVHDSAVDPNRFGRHTDLAMAAGSEAAFRDGAALTARRDGTYHLGDTPAEVRASSSRTSGTRRPRCPRPGHAPRTARRARLLQTDGGRGHAVYGFPGALACGTAMVDAYLAEGRLPARDTTCPSAGAPRTMTPGPDLDARRLVSPVREAPVTGADSGWNPVGPPLPSRGVSGGPVPDASRQRAALKPTGRK